VRPVTYIQEHIDQSWLPYLVTPQFPEYPSGHSFISGSAAASAAAVLGEQAFTDSSNHQDDARSFDSFADAAEEAASSRLYGGVHYPMGIEGGTELGTCIGEVAAQRLQGAA
jgi:membrane-associated phospholipid phosphatase